MALEKTIENSAGFTGNYWRIVKMERQNNGCVIEIAPFKDRQSALDRKSQMAPSMLISSPNCLISVDAGYTYLKTQPFFADAVDALEDLVEPEIPEEPEEPEIPED